MIGRDRPGMGQVDWSDGRRSCGLLNRRAPEAWRLAESQQPVDRARPVENAQNAFPTPPTAVLGLRKKNEEQDSRLRARTESDDTHATYRVAGFQTFLSGRI